MLHDVAQSTFPAADSQVEVFGAQPCAVVAQTSPYSDPTKSPVNSGAEAAQASGSFDSLPASLGAIAACNAAGGGVVVPSGTWYCAGPIYAYNVHNIVPQNVMIGGQLFNTTVTEAR
ncbi:hypothetical protein ACS7SF_18660 (plasmid) [Ralstonia sp. 25C]|uniref:hypothetical protein n=1 Tax=Ralstonia sp. 25C TaxID=3447363 RepID=UPI003F753CB2